MPLSLTDLPLLVLESILISTRDPQELHRSCRVFYEISKSNAIRSRWIINNFGFHAIEAAVLDYPKLFHIYKYYLRRETLDVLLNMYGSVPRYVMHKIYPRCPGKVLECLWTRVDKGLEEEAKKYSVDTFTEEMHPFELGLYDWFEELVANSKRADKARDDLTNFLEHFGLPGLWAMSYPSHSFKTTFRFSLPRLFKRFVAYICCPNSTVSAVECMLQNGMTTVLPRLVPTTVEKEFREKFQIRSPITIYSENGINSEKYFFGAGSVSSISRLWDVDLNFSRREIAKSLVTVDLDSVLFALLFERYEIAELLLEHDAKRWRTTKGKKNLQYMNVICRALEDEQGIALVGKYMDDDDTAPFVEQSARQLGIILDFFARVANSDVEGTKQIVSTNASLFARADLERELAFHTEYLDELAWEDLSSRDKMMLKLSRQLMELLSTKRCRYHHRSWFPEYLCLCLGDDQNFGASNGNEDVELYFRDYRSDFDNSDEMVLDVEPLVDDERDEKEGDISSVDSGDLEGKEWDYGDEDSDEEEEEEEEEEEGRESEEEEKEGEYDECEDSEGYDSGGNFDYEYGIYADSEEDARMCDLQSLYY